MAKYFLVRPGSFTVTIDATGCNTQIPVKYEIKLSNKTNYPSNVKFWITRDTVTRIDNSTYIGTTLGQTTVTETVNWEWEFDSNTAENSFQNSNFSAQLEIKVYSSN